MFRVKTRSPQHRHARRLDGDAANALFFEMLADQRQESVRVGIDHEAYLANGFGKGRNGILRLLGIACDERQHLESIPAKYLFSTAQPWFAPPGIYLRISCSGDNRDAG